ncbi:Protein of unknown function [Gryllus bimaculatus]|nr:Protein of unknown function [Gryllus bimaculatus]
MAAGVAGNMGAARVARSGDDEDGTARGSGICPLLPSSWSRGEAPRALPAGRRGEARRGGRAMGGNLSAPSVGRESACARGRGVGNGNVREGRGRGGAGVVDHRGSRAVRARPTLIFISSSLLAPGHRSPQRLGDARAGSPAVPPPARNTLAQPSATPGPINPPRPSLTKSPLRHHRPDDHHRLARGPPFARPPAPAPPPRRHCASQFSINGPQQRVTRRHYSRDAIAVPPKRLHPRNCEDTESAPFETAMYRAPPQTHQDVRCKLYSHLKFSEIGRKKELSEIVVTEVLTSKEERSNWFCVVRAYILSFSPPSNVQHAGINADVKGESKKPGRV